MKKPLLAATLAFLFAGCGGGGGGSSPAALPAGTISQTGQQVTVPLSNPPGSAVVTASANVPVTANLPYDASVVATTASSGRKVQSITGDRSLATLRRTLSISTVQVNGYLYQGTASATQITNQVTLTPSGNALAVSIPFSNAVVAPNSWVYLQFRANAPDGTQYYMGSLGGIVNVTAAGAAVTIDTNSTLRLSALLVGLNRGGISSYEIENSATLDADIGTFLTAGGYTTDPTTLLYSGQTRQQIGNDISAKYARSLTITTGASTPATVSVAYDYTQPDENNLLYNVAQSPALVASTASSFSAGAPKLPGSPTFSNNASSLLTQHSPSVNAGLNALAGTVNAYYISAPTGSVTTPVYGGHILVGAHALTTQINDATTQQRTGQYNVTEPYPFVGGNAAVAGRAPGSTPSVAVTMASTAVTATLVDAQRNASSPAPTVSATPLPLPTQGFTTSNSNTSPFGTPSFNGVYGFNGNLTSVSYPNTPGARITATYGGPSNVPPGLPALTGTAIQPLYYISLVSNQNVAFNPGTFMTFNIFSNNNFVQLPCGSNYYLAGYDSSRAASGWFLQIVGPQSACPNSGSQNVTFSWSSVPNITLTSGVQYGLALYAQGIPSPSPSALPLLTSLGSATLTTAPLNATGGPTFTTTCATTTIYCYMATYTNVSGGGIFTSQSFTPPNTVPSLITSGTTAMIDVWNPFNIPAASLYSCGVAAQCTPVTNGATVTQLSTFFDNGDNLSYYNWTPAGATTGITPNLCWPAGYSNATTCGYTVAFNGLAGSFSSTTPGLFTQNQSIQVSSTAPLGTIWTITVTDAASNTYTASAPAALLPFANASNTVAYLNMSSIAALSVKSATITFSYQLPAGTTPGTFSIYGL